jgi:hypothetical protein
MAADVCSVKFSIPDALEPVYCSTDFFKFVACKTESTVSYPCGVKCSIRKGCKTKMCSKSICVPGTEKQVIRSVCGAKPRWKVISPCELVPGNLKHLMDQTKQMCKCVDKLNKFLTNGLANVLENSENVIDQTLVEALKSVAEIQSCFVDKLVRPTSNKDEVVNRINAKYDTVKWSSREIDTTLYLQFVNHAVLCGFTGQCTSMAQMVLDFVDEVKASTFGELDSVGELLGAFFGTIKTSFKRIVGELTNPNYSPFTNIGKCLVSRYTAPFAQIVDPICCPNSLIPESLKLLQSEFKSWEGRLNEYEAATKRLAAINSTVILNSDELAAVKNLAQATSTNVVNVVRQFRQDMIQMLTLVDEVPSLLEDTFNKITNMDQFITSTIAKLNQIEEGIQAMNDIMNSGLLEKIQKFQEALEEIVQLAKSRMNLQGFLARLLRKGDTINPKKLFEALFGKESLANSIKDIQQAFKALKDSTKITRFIELVDDIKQWNMVSDIQAIQKNVRNVVKNAEKVLQRDFLSAHQRNLQQFLSSNQKELDLAVEMINNGTYKEIADDLGMLVDIPDVARQRAQNITNTLENNVKNWTDSVKGAFSLVGEQVQQDFSKISNFAETIINCDPVLHTVSEYAKDLTKAVRKWSPNKLQIEGGVASYSRSANIEFDWVCSKMGRQKMSAFGYDISFDAPEFERCDYRNKIKLPNHHMPYIGISLGGFEKLRDFPTLPVPGNDDSQDLDPDEVNLQKRDLQKRDFSWLSITDYFQEKRKQCLANNLVDFPLMSLPCMPKSFEGYYFNHYDPNNSGTCIFDVEGLMDKELIPGVPLRKFTSKGDRYVRLSPPAVRCAMEVRLKYSTVSFNSYYRSSKHNEEVYERKRQEFLKLNPGKEIPKKLRTTTRSRHISGTAVDLQRLDAKNIDDTVNFALDVLDICYRKYGMNAIGIGIYGSPGLIHLDHTREKDEAFIHTDKDIGISLSDWQKKVEEKLTELRKTRSVSNPPQPRPVPTNPQSPTNPTNPTNPTDPSPAAIPTLGVICEPPYVRTFYPCVSGSGRCSRCSLPRDIRPPPLPTLPLPNNPFPLPTSLPEAPFNCPSGFEIVYTDCSNQPCPRCSRKLSIPGQLNCRNGYISVNYDCDNLPCPRCEPLLMPELPVPRPGTPRPLPLPDVIPRPGGGPRPIPDIPLPRPGGPRPRPWTDPSIPGPGQPHFDPSILDTPIRPGRGPLFPQ